MPYAVPFATASARRHSLVANADSDWVRREVEDVVGPGRHDPGRVAVRQQPAVRGPHPPGCECEPSSVKSSGAGASVIASDDLLCGDNLCPSQVRQTPVAPQPPHGTEPRPRFIVLDPKHHLHVPGLSFRG